MPVQETRGNGRIPATFAMKLRLEGRFDSMKGKAKLVNPLDSEDDMHLPMNIDEEAWNRFHAEPKCPPELDGSPHNETSRVARSDIPVEESDIIGQFCAGVD